MFAIKREGCGLIGRGKWMIKKGGSARSLSVLIGWYLFTRNKSCLIAFVDTHLFPMCWDELTMTQLNMFVIMVRTFFPCSTTCSMESCRWCSIFSRLASRRRIQCSVNVLGICSESFKAEDSKILYWSLHELGSYILFYISCGAYEFHFIVAFFSWDLHKRRKTTWIYIRHAKLEKKNIDIKFIKNCNYYYTCLLSRKYFRILLKQ